MAGRLADGKHIDGKLIQHERVALGDFDIQA